MRRTLNEHLAIPFAPELRLDVREAATSGRQPVVLLWHGRGPCERDVLGPLSVEIARQGAVVVTPDWRSSELDGGRADLLASLSFTRDRAGDFGGDPNRLTVAGWSMGARAALSIALAPELAATWRPRAVVGIGGTYDDVAPTTDVSLWRALGGQRVIHAEIRLVAGRRDEVVGVEPTRDFAKLLREAGRTVRTFELETDHAGLIMTRFDLASGRCRPTADPRINRLGTIVASAVLSAAP